MFITKIINKTKNENHNNKNPNKAKSYETWRLSQSIQIGQRIFRNVYENGVDKNWLEKNIFRLGIDSEMNVGGRWGRHNTGPIEIDEI